MLTSILREVWRSDMAYATSAEYATFSGSNDETATATTTIDSGAVDSITIGAGGGYGYTTAPDVVVDAPDSGVRATVTATITNGVVSALTIEDGGSGYTEAPDVTIDPPHDVDRLLERATELVDDYIKTAIYATDEDGDPTDSDVIAALRDAVCAQVEFWLTSDEEDAILGPADSVALSGLTAPGHELAPRAATILRRANLYSIDTVTP